LGEPQLADFDRPLNPRGRKAAEAVGRELERRGLRFDHVVASPAVRVRQTLDRLTGGYGELPDIRFVPAIYEAPLGALAEIVRAIPDECRSALLVGHNPGLQQLVLELSRGARGPLRERVAERFPTAATAIIDFDVESWRQTNAGELADLIVPRELD
jgi:phosphohistidine phosphatase